MEAILTAKDAEFEAKLLQQINPLKEQLQLHTHTTGILVAEKAELTATLDQCRATINQKTGTYLTLKLIYFAFTLTILTKKNVPVYVWTYYKFLYSGLILAIIYRKFYN